MRAAAAEVSTDTVGRFEREDELKEQTIDALQRALEAAGIEFTNGNQPGVRLTKGAAARSAEPGSAQIRREALPRGNKNALKYGLYTCEAIEERRQLRALKVPGGKGPLHCAVVCPALLGAHKWPEATVGLFDQSHWYSRPTPKGWFA